MPSAFDQIVSAFVAKLQEAPVVCDVIVEDEGRAVDEACQETVVVFYDGSSMPDMGVITGAPLDWTSRIVVDCFARSKTVTGRKAADALMKRVFERLATNPNLGNFEWFIGFPSIDVEIDLQAQRTGVARLTYFVQHRTRNNILE
ncbi:MAG: hypothetical protein K2X63_11120 [Burkholderiaceae bacterium]|nr:hypothetical protein [Burkholderiaceae bacterium]